MKVRDTPRAKGAVALLSGAVARWSTDGSGIALPLPGTLKARPVGLAVPAALRRVASSRRAGPVAVGVILVSSLLTVAFAASGPSVLVARSSATFPGWESGPLHGLIPHFVTNPLTYEIGLSVVSLVMVGAYLLVLGAVRSLSLRVIVGAILALHAIYLLGPPLTLTDIFNYIGYARLGAVHGINAYAHGIGMESHDPVYQFTTWHHLKSPYGPLFTLVSYSFAWLPLAASFWIMKLAAVLTSLGFLALVAKAARLLGRDPRYALVFVAANPVFLLYEVGGFHNDFFMLIPSMAAIVLVLGRRDRSAGAVLMLAVAVKFTAILLLPFMFLAAASGGRRRRLVLGAGAAALPLAAASFAAFGAHLPDLGDQSTLLTDFSVPNVVGWVLGFGGGAPLLLRVGNVLLIVTVALLLRQRRAWLEGSGWATLALLATLAWLVPWYVVWLLPLAALGRSLYLRRAAVIATVYLVLTFMPATGPLMGRLHLAPMGGGPGINSRILQGKLAG